MILALALYYEFGRYLLISCSRPGGQPAKSRVLVRENEAGPTVDSLSRIGVAVSRAQRQGSVCTEERGKRRCPLPRAPIPEATSSACSRSTSSLETDIHTSPNALI